MSGAVEHTRNQPAVNPRLMPAIDQLLIAGIKLGPTKKHQAINRILELVPEWRRGDCWRRIRRLRRTRALADIQAAEETSDSTDFESRQRTTVSRPWLPEDDDKLLELAGYEPVETIAEQLGRSELAVRSRLGALGVSARVSDGWSQRAMRKLLCMSCRRLRQLVASGLLKVRDPHITGASLTAWRAQFRGLTRGRLRKATASPTVFAGPYSWKRAARILKVEIAEVQKLISLGRLQLVDTFVPEEEFEEFCRKHGDAINLSLIDSSIRKWLTKEYGVPAGANEKPLSRTQKHVRIIHVCRCGRKIAGNSYFWHVRCCAETHHS